MKIALELIFFLFKKISHWLRLAINFCLLTLMYFLGVGLTALVAKMSKKSFLSFNPEKSTWKKAKASELNKMY